MLRWREISFSIIANENGFYVAWFCYRLPFTNLPLLSCIIAHLQDSPYDYIHTALSINHNPIVVFVVSWEEAIITTCGLWLMDCSGGGLLLFSDMVYAVDFHHSTHMVLCLCVYFSTSCISSCVVLTGWYITHYNSINLESTTVIFITY